MAAIKNSSITVKRPLDAGVIDLITAQEYERLRHASAIYVSPDDLSFPRIDITSFTDTFIAEVSGLIAAEGYNGALYTAAFGSVVRSEGGGFDEAEIFFAVEAENAEQQTCWFLYQYEY